MTPEELPMTAEDWRALARLAYTTAEALRPTRRADAERFERLGARCAHRAVMAAILGVVVP